MTLFNALELFQPYLIKKMLQLKIINSIREGKKKIKEEKEIVNKILLKIIEKVWFSEDY